MSQTYSSAIIIILAQLLPSFGIELSSDQLTTTVQTLVTLIAGVWILIRRYQAGDIKLSGARR